MKRLLLLFCALLTGVSGAWADVLPSAAVGTYAFQANTLTTGADGYTITKDGSGNVTISPNNSGVFGTTESNYLRCTLVIKINVPSTTTAGVLCQMRTNSNDVPSAQGLYMAADRKLQTCWGNNNGTITARTDGYTLSAGEHTIIYVANSGATVYIDGTSNTLTDSGLKASGKSYKAIYIPAAYASYITEVHYFSSVQNATNIASIVTECSNHMQASQQTGESVTVPSGKTLVIDADNNLSKYSFGGAVNIAVASGKTLTLNKDNISISTLSGSGTALQSTEITTTVTGNVSDITLKATAGTLTYTGTNLSGSTLDGIVLASSARINISNTVTIKNLAGNDLTAGSNNYVFVSSDPANLILEGTCDFTHKSDATDATFNNIGIGNTSGSITVKSGANVSCGKIWHGGNLTNAPITVESGATLTSLASEGFYATTITNNGTITAAGPLWANTITLGEGSTTTLSHATPFTGGAVTVSGDATLELTNTTAALNPAITVAAGKTLTIDGDNKTVNLTSAPTLGTGSAINFKNATLTANFDDRSLANYTFTSCTATAQFTETGTEYAAGGFTITNIPSGVTIKVKKYGTTEYETVTTVDGTATFSHSVEVSGSAAWLDYTFDETTLATNKPATPIGNVPNRGNAGSGQTLTIDNGYKSDVSYNEDGTFKVRYTPYRNMTWPENYTVAVSGNFPDVENGCLVAFGTKSANYLALIRGANSNEIKLVKGKGANTYTNIQTMAAENATAAAHLVIFTKQGSVFKVYCDGVNVATTTYDQTLGGGLQVGSIHGGYASTGVVSVMDNSLTDDQKNAVFCNAIRVYDYIISDAQMEALKTEFPYVSQGGNYTRTISEDANLDEDDAWYNVGEETNTNLPTNNVVEEVTYYPDIVITTTATSTLTVNADMDSRNMEFDGTGTLTIESDGTHMINIYSSISVNGPISVKYGAADLSSVPVSIGESGSIEFDFSDYDFSGVTTSTDYPVTGLTSDYGAKVTSVYPSDIYHTYSLAFNGTTNSYYLTVGPTVALKQKLAKDLVKPYYDGSLVSTSLGRYTIKLGETSYANLEDFKDAVDEWESLGDCVEPTITLNTPSAGFYRLKNVATGKYLTAVSGPYGYQSTTKGVYANGDANSAATVIKLYDKEGNGKLYMYNQGYGFGWTDAGKVDGSGAVGYLTTNPDKYVNWFQGTSAGQLGFAICYGNGTGAYASYLERCIYTVDEDDESVIAGTDYTVDAAQWIVEEATTVTIALNTVGDKSYATFSAPFDVTIGADATACQIDLDTENNRAVYTAIEDNEVPAGTGVLIISDEAASSVTATINNGSAFSALVGNDLVGYNLATTFSYPDETTDWNLVLGNSATTGIGFYKMNGTASPNKAYLPYPHTAGSLVKSFRLISADDLETGIEEIEVKQQSEAVYDLSGRRVNNPGRGLYITKGQIVVK